MVRGAYAPLERPDDVRTRVEALALVLPSDATVSHRTALWLLGLDVLIDRLCCGGVPFGIPQTTIATGQPANVTLVDLQRRWVVGENGYESRSENCCFAGRRICLVVASEIVVSLVVVISVFRYSIHGDVSIGQIGELPKLALRRLFLAQLRSGFWHLDICLLGDLVKAKPSNIACQLRGLGSSIGRAASNAVRNLLGRRRWNRHVTTERLVLCLFLPSFCCPQSLLDFLGIWLVHWSRVA